MESRASIYRPNLELRCLERPKSMREQVEPLIRELVDELSTAEGPGQTIIYTFHVGLAKWVYNKGKEGQKGYWYHKREGAIGMADLMREMIDEASDKIDGTEVCSRPSPSAADPLESPLKAPLILKPPPLTRSLWQRIRIGVYHGLKLPKFKFEDETDAAFERRRQKLTIEQMEQRETTQREFKEGKLTVVVATDAFGQGINNACVL